MDSAVKPKGRTDQKKANRRTDILCKVKYTNSLPDIPFEPKSFRCTFDLQRFVDYRATSLEKGHKWDLRTDSESMVSIDLVNRAQYAVTPEYTLHPDDERLLEDEPMNANNIMRAQLNARVVPWLRKTEYVGTNTSASLIDGEDQRRPLAKKRIETQDMYLTKEHQMKAIEESFQYAQTPMDQHYSKPNVHKVAEWYVYPDEDLWAHQCAQVIFDDDPSMSGKATDTANSSNTSQHAKHVAFSLARGMNDGGDHFIGYFLPTEETLQTLMNEESGKHENKTSGTSPGDDVETIKCDDSGNADQDLDHQENDQEKEYKYKLARQYNWTVRSGTASGLEENFFFLFRDNHVSYSQLQTRVRLNKRRIPERQLVATDITIKHRPFNEKEVRRQMRRLRRIRQIESDEDIAASASSEESDGNSEIEEDEDVDEEVDEMNPTTELRTYSPSYCDTSARGPESIVVEEKKQADEVSNNSDDEDDDMDSSVVQSKRRLVSESSDDEFTMDSTSPSSAMKTPVPYDADPHAEDSVELHESLEDKTESLNRLDDEEDDVTGCSYHGDDSNDKGSLSADHAEESDDHGDEDEDDEYDTKTCQSSEEGDST